MITSMRSHHLNLVQGGLYRSPLRIKESTEDPAAHHRSWDLGYHHAKRGKQPEPDNPAVADRQAYMDGYQASKAETAGSSQDGPGDRSSLDVEPSMNLPTDDIPKSVGTVSSAINSAGGRALLIGGSVRDKLMGKPSKDWDIEVYGMHPDHLEQELGKLGRVDAVGKSFGVLKIVVGDEDFDVSVPRRESKAGRGHKGFIPVPDPNMTLSDATKRRDFTMNTISMDPHSGEVYDPHGGVEDIKSRVLRATDPTAFVEDPLRILRGAQFAARFGMTVEPGTMDLMRQASVELPDLPKERVGGEWRKLLMKGQQPSAGLDVMKDAGVLRSLHPTLDELSNSDRWEQTKQAVDRATQLTGDATPETKEAVRFAALFHGADVEGLADTLHNSFDVPKGMAAHVASLVGEHQAMKGDHSDEDIRRLSHRIVPANIEDLALLHRAIHGGGADETAHSLVNRAQGLGVSRSAPKPILMGRHLIQMGIKPGPHIGKVISQVFDKQLSGHVTDLESAKQAAQTAMLQRESLILPIRWSNP